MTKFSVTMFGRKETRRALDRVAKRGKMARDDVAELLGERVLNYAKHLIATSPASGRVYVREAPARVHQASDPGEPPASDTGALINSLTLREVPINQYAFSVVVGSNLHYAPELEFLVPNPRILPRPFLQPAVDFVESEVGETLMDAWNRNNI